MYAHFTNFISEVTTVHTCRHICPQLFHTKLKTPLFNKS